MLTSECLFILPSGERGLKKDMGTQNKRPMLLNFLISDTDFDLSFQDSSFTK